VNLEEVKRVLLDAPLGATRDQLVRALGSAVAEIDYLQRMAQAYKETAEGRLPNVRVLAVAHAARTLSELTDRRLDDPSSTGDGRTSWDAHVDPAAEARDDELGACGDPRRCPRHPHVQTSSADGLHDAPCGECESDQSDEDPA
jgi:hypothetical protein